MSLHKTKILSAFICVHLRLILLVPLFAQPPVEVVKVISKSVDRKFALPGEFAPYQTVAIHAKVTGFLDKIEVDRGSVVTKGQLLATLVAPELKAQRLEAEAKVQAAVSQRAEAEARLVAVESTYLHLKAASETPGVVAGNDVTLAEKAVDAERAKVKAVEGSIAAAKASVATLQDMENYLEVTAPFDGVITERNVHPGALVGPGGSHDVPMFQLEQNSRLRLVVAVPEVDVSGISMGASVPFTVPAYPGQTFTGKVARVAHSMDAKTRSMAVELEVANPRMQLAPGMYPTVMWPVHRARPSLLVPPAAIVTTTERTFVIRVKPDGQVEWVAVTRGAPAGDMVEVFGALSAGDTVVRRASDEIREGARVTVKPS